MKRYLGSASCPTSLSPRGVRIYGASTQANYRTAGAPGRRYLQAAAVALRPEHPTRCAASHRSSLLSLVGVGRRELALQAEHLGYEVDSLRPRVSNAVRPIQWTSERRPCKSTNIR